MSVRAVEPSLSPSMDIQVSSNFERLLFELLDRDPARTAATMQDFRASGRMAVPPEGWRQMRALFSSFRLDDPGTLSEMRRLDRAGYLADPHSAIGIAGGRAANLPAGLPMVAMATAHPAKFPDAVQQATGRRPPLPARLADLYERDEHFTRAPADLATIEARVRAFVQRNAA